MGLPNQHKEAVVTLIEQFVDELEMREKAEDMHFSLYFIPSEFQPEGNPYDQ